MSISRLCRLFAGIVPVAFLAACAGTPPPPEQKAAAADQKVECEMTYKTGSMVPKRDCAPPLTEEERRRVQDDLANKVRQNSARPPGK